MEHGDFRGLFGLASLSEEQALKVYVGRQFSRIVAHGVDYDVAQRVIGRIARLDDWAPQWAKEGAHWEALGAQARRAGHAVSARDAFFLASNCYRVGQHILHDDAEKMAYYPKVVKLYEAAAQLMRPAWQTVSIASPFGPVAAYWCLPEAAAKPPAVILAGGADGWREEYLPATLAFLKRGFAVLNVDAPGQGAARLFRKKPMPVPVEKFFSAAIDFLLRTRKIDAKRIFMVGHSVGGYLTLRTASRERRLAACASLGGPYELLSIFDGSPAARQINFALLCGAREPQQARETLRQFTLDGMLKDVSCPVLVVHGMKDSVIPYSQIERICADLGKRAELHTWEDGIHTCDNYVGEVYPFIADRFLDLVKKPTKKSRRNAR